MVLRRHLGILAALTICAAGPGAAGAYADVEMGFEIQPPQGWNSQPTMTPREGLRTKVWTSPDQKGALSVTLLAIPQPPAPPQVYLRGDETASRRMSPDAYQLLSQDALTVHGLEGWGSVSRFAVNGTAVQRRRAYFASGDKLYLVIGDAAPADYGQLSEAFEAATVSFGIAGGPKPNSFQVVAGNTYTDTENGFSVMKPAADWILYTTTSPIPTAKRLLIASAPDGLSYASVTVLPQPKDLTAEQGVRRDLAFLKKSDPGIKVHATAVRQLDGVDGYAFLAEFGNGEKQMRWAVYAVNKGLLYMLITDSTPAKSYEQWKDAFGRFADSFKFGERKPAE